MNGPVRFAGYAAIFDRIDRGKDIIRPGAFRASLERRGRVPLLWQHQPGRVIGEIEHLREDGRGLQVIGRLRDDAFGRMLGRELARSTISGLSFGYRVRAQHRGQSHRTLNEVDLLEVSIVRQPMQPLAQIHKVAG